MPNHLQIHTAVVSLKGPYREGRSVTLQSFTEFQQILWDPMIPTLFYSGWSCHEGFQQFPRDPNTSLHRSASIRPQGGYYVLSASQWHVTNVNKLLSEPK